MLQTSDDEEQLAAGKALWTLAFDDGVKQKIIEQPGCLEALEALTTSEKGTVRQTVKGALWVIKAGHKKGKVVVAQNPSKTGLRKFSEPLICVHFIMKLVCILVDYLGSVKTVCLFPFLSLVYQEEKGKVNTE